jgi:acyl-CoA thioesterase
MNMADAMTPQELAHTATQAMWTRDNATHALGMTLESVAPGHAVMRMTVRSDMVNGHHFATAA